MSETPELPPVNPDLHDEQSVTALQVHFEDLRAQPDIKSDVLLGDNASAVIAPGNIIGGGDAHRAGISQEPMAIIKTNVADNEGDAYSVLSIKDEQTNGTKLVLARWGETADSRATIIGEITEKGMIVGRNHDNAQNLLTSRKHFSVRKNEQGNLVIDSKGQNGTEVFSKSTEVQQAEVSVKGLKKGFMRRTNRPQQVMPPAHPLEGKLFWSAKTAEAAELFARTKHDRQNYELPHDQIQAEFDLIDKYRKEMPGQSVVLGQALKSIAQVVGEAGPDLQLVGRIDGAPLSDADKEIVDEDGYLKWNPDAKGMRSYSMPLIDALPEPKPGADSNEIWRYESSLKGTPLGEVPAEAEQMLKDIYALTGAVILRDDMAEEVTGLVLRKGTYHGKEFFIQEYRQQYVSMSLDEITNRTDLTFVNLWAGSDAPLHSLSKKDLDRLEAIGIDRFSAQDAMIKHQDVDNIIAFERQFDSGQ